MKGFCIYYESEAEAASSSVSSVGYSAGESDVASEEGRVLSLLDKLRMYTHEILWNK